MMIIIFYCLLMVEEKPFYSVYLHLIRWGIFSPYSKFTLYLTRAQCVSTVS